MAPNTKKLYHATRKAHRAVLRAVKDDNIPSMREQLHGLYDPFASPLAEVTEGPCKQAFVPVVDALLLAEAKKCTACSAELRDNVASIGHTFGLDEVDIRNVNRAADAAANGEVEAMNQYLADAGFEDSGMCMPEAIAAKHQM